ncbi:hypothetical protein M2244_003795 [Rhodoferax antarcticus]|nr:hypothetical protein [Rhodoferax antarcticus]
MAALPRQSKSKEGIWVLEICIDCNGQHLCFYQKITDIYALSVDYSVEARTPKTSLSMCKTSCIGRLPRQRLPGKTHPIDDENEL